MTDHPVPSVAARELVSGAYDTHVHIAPDVMDRRIDDLSLAGSRRPQLWLGDELLYPVRGKSELPDQLNLAELQQILAPKNLRTRREAQIRNLRRFPQIPERATVSPEGGS